MKNIFIRFKWKVFWITILYVLGAFVNELRLEAYQRIDSSQIALFVLYALVLFLIGLIVGFGHHAPQQDVILVRALWVVILILWLLPFLLSGISHPLFSSILSHLLQGNSVTLLPLALGYLTYPSIKGKSKE